MKSFKTQSKKILDMMINSIYTHKEIFLRELLSNASDALDKLYFKSINGGETGLTRNDFAITIQADHEAKVLTISDNGIGMTASELEENLGTIAQSGTLAFKEENKLQDDMNAIGQFGVGFYSAFMVAKKVEVISKAYGSDEANIWSSEGVEGYEIKKTEKAENGTTIKLYLKDNTDDDKYDIYLEDYELKDLIKKYSNYISYPIKLYATKYIPSEDKDKEGEYVKEWETVNAMVPLWKKAKKDITDEEYNDFYKNMFYDMENPISVINTKAEGAIEYKALLFIPQVAPYNYYNKEYEKGLKLYTNGVLITDRCEDLLPDYFNFVKGVVDTDLPLNVSRETIQHNRQLQKIASNIENKIKDELTSMLKNKREDYEKFYKAFGMQLKFGCYANYGMNKEKLQDLLMFYSINQKKMITLKEYVDAMSEDQKNIYYATGSTVEQIENLPQCEKVLEKGYDILCLTEYIDEFVTRVLNEYDKKPFKSVAQETFEEDKKEEALTDEEKNALTAIKEVLKDEVKDVKFTTNLKTHAVCLTSEGNISIEMEKVLNAMPNAQENPVKAQKILEINKTLPIYSKIMAIYQDKEALEKIVYIMFNQARLIEGLNVENPTKLADTIMELISK